MGIQAQMIIGASLVVLLLKMHPATPASVTPAESVVASVNIYNLIRAEGREKREVQVSCGSQGRNSLTFGGHYRWMFTLSRWPGTDRTYSCGFEWGNKYQHFYVWVDPSHMPPRQAFKPCLHCVWDIQREGFYVSESGEIPQIKIIHKWLTDDAFLSNMTIHE